MLEDRVEFMVSFIRNFFYMVSIYRRMPKVITRYRIDAITLFAVPATGPHGFHTLGRSVRSQTPNLS